MSGGQARSQMKQSLSMSGKVLLLSSPHAQTSPALDAIHWHCANRRLWLHTTPQATGTSDNEEESMGEPQDQTQAGLDFTDSHAAFEQLTSQSRGHN